MPQARFAIWNWTLSLQVSHIFTKRCLKLGCELALVIVTSGITSLLSDASSSVAIWYWTLSLQREKINNDHKCDLALDIVTSSITSLLSHFKYHIFTKRCLKLGCELALDIVTSGITSLLSDASSSVAIFQRTLSLQVSHLY